MTSQEFLQIVSAMNDAERHEIRSLLEITLIHPEAQSPTKPHRTVHGQGRNRLGRVLEFASNHAVSAVGHTERPWKEAVRGQGRVGSFYLLLDGVLFSWSLVGHDPYVVTVRNSSRGSWTELTRDNPRALARQLAEKLLAKSRGNG
jgi:hypothetical protein